MEDVYTKEVKVSGGLSYDSQRLTHGKDIRIFQHGITGIEREFVYACCEERADLVGTAVILQPDLKASKTKASRVHVMQGFCSRAHNGHPKAGQRHKSKAALEPIVAVFPGSLLTCLRQRRDRRRSAKRRSKCCGEQVAGPAKSPRRRQSDRRDETGGGEEKPPGETVRRDIDSREDGGERKQSLLTRKSNHASPPPRSLPPTLSPSSSSSSSPDPLHPPILPISVLPIPNLSSSSSPSIPPSHSSPTPPFLSPVRHLPPSSSGLDLQTPLNLRLSPLQLGRLFLSLLIPPLRDAAVAMICSRLWFSRIVSAVNARSESA
ncbi:hypothetical protein M432DRAFT_587082 [Thermoascus aurantiacus ATCC 26904]